jgi:non-heme chloroperoxidase
MKFTNSLLSLALGILLPLQATSTQSIRSAAIRDAFAKTNGIRIHYLESGDATSVRALVLIPGWRLPAYLWRKQLEAFAPLMRVIAIDPRSQGPSTKTSDGNTPEVRALDLHGLLGELKISRSVLVGWSQGAQDVSAYLQHFGADSVAGVVLVDSPVSAGPAEVSIHSEFSRIALANISRYAAGPQQFSDRAVRGYFKYPHPDIDMRRLLDATSQTPTDVGVSMLVADIFGADRRPALAKLSKPALVIASDQSPLLDVQKEEAAGIPGATFVVINDAAHAVFVDQPEKFDASLRSFLAMAFSEKGRALVTPP